LQVKLVACVLDQPDSLAKCESFGSWLHRPHMVVSAGWQIGNSWSLIHLCHLLLFVICTSHIWWRVYRSGLMYWINKLNKWLQLNKHGS